MSDTYQPIYDAVRRQIGSVDLERVAREAFDISWAMNRCEEAIKSAAYAYDRPSAVYRPTVSLDGNMYCALYGEDLMSGCAGFGETMDAAMWDFDKNWREQKAPKMKTPGRSCPSQPPTWRRGPSCSSYSDIASPLRQKFKS